MRYRLALRRRPSCCFHMRACVDSAAAGGGGGGGGGGVKRHHGPTWADGDEGGVASEVVGQPLSVPCHMVQVLGAVRSPGEESDVRFELAGEFRDLEVEEREPKISGSTGDPLRRIGLDFQVGPQLQGGLDKQLRAADRKAPILDEDGGQWVIGSWSYSYNDAGSARRYTVELDELERIEPTHLAFDGMRFSVKRYEEFPGSGDDESRLLLAEVEANAEQTGKLRRLLQSKDYFDLVRVGVSDNPMRVRMGQPVWQRVGDEGEMRRFQLALVTEEGDDPSDRGSDPSPWNLQRIALQERARLRSLLDELESISVLSNEARERVDAAATTWKDDRLELREVDDVSTHWL